MDTPKPKKPFKDPELVVYGDIREITQSVGMTGAVDTGGHGANNMTR